MFFSGNLTCLSWFCGSSHINFQLYPTYPQSFICCSRVVLINKRNPLRVTTTEASVPDGEAEGPQSSPQADEPPPPPPPGELACSPEAAGPEPEAEEKVPAQAAEPAAAAPREGPDLSPPSAPQPEPPPEREEAPRPQPAAPALVPPEGGVSAGSQLIPGSEVRVTLDHIIEDALVVLFCLGEKVFSGVLLDLSKRYEVQRLPLTAFHSVSCDSTHCFGFIVQQRVSC